MFQIRDRQISISLGKPALINDTDCDVEILEEHDLSTESQLVKSYVLEQARLSVIGESQSG